MYNVCLGPSLEDRKSQFCHAAAKKCCDSGNLLIWYPDIWYPDIQPQTCVQASRIPDTRMINIIKIMIVKVRMMIYNNTRIMSDSYISMMIYFDTQMMIIVDLIWSNGLDTSNNIIIFVNFVYSKTLSNWLIRSWVGVGGSVCWMTPRVALTKIIVYDWAGFLSTSSLLFNNYSPKDNFHIMFCPKNCVLSKVYLTKDFC